jgi:hypothetical protein
MHHPVHQVKRLTNGHNPASHTVLRKYSAKTLDICQKYEYIEYKNMYIYYSWTTLREKKAMWEAQEKNQKIKKKVAAPT